MARFSPDVTTAGPSGRIEVRNPAGRSNQTSASVTVVIPCFNYAQFLPTCVASALTQTGVSVDIVIVDDASTDGSLDVARALAKDDPRVIIVENVQNQGPVATFNNGLARVTGEFVVRLDADDLLTPGCLARAVALFEAFPDVGMVYGHPVHFSGTVPEVLHDSVSRWTVWPGAAWLERRCRLGVNCVTSPEVVMRRSVVDRVGGQRELAHTHDMEMWMRLAAVCDIGHLQGPDQALHREHLESRSARMVDALTDLNERRMAFDMVFEGLGAELDDGAALHAMAMHALATEALVRACHAYDRGRAQRTPIDELVAFALDVYPASRELRQWRALVRRRRVGPRFVHLLPPFIAMAVLRRIRDDIAYRRWTVTGV